MLEHLSYSSISSYLACPRNWFYHYVEKRPVPVAIPLFFGSVFHGAIENYISSKASSKPEDLLTCWQVSWESQFAKEGESVEWGVDTPDQHYNEGVRILGDPSIQYGINTISPMIGDDGPVIERKVTLAVPGVPIPIIGYIDCIAADGVPLDFKTASRSWTDDQAANELQPLFYLAALNQAGLKPDGRFRHYIFVKNKTPKIQIIETKHDLRKMLFLFQVISDAWRGMSLEYYPAIPTTWKCSSQYCDYWALCRGRYG